MKIIKKFQGTVPDNKIVDTYTTSQTDTYSCNYVNNAIANSKTNMTIIYNNTSATTTGEVSIPYSTYSKYDFLYVCADEASILVTPQWFTGSLITEEYNGDYGKDFIYIRQTWFNSNDNTWHIGHCYARGINGYTGYEQVDNRLIVRLIFGIKL